MRSFILIVQWLVAALEFEDKPPTPPSTGMSRSTQTEKATLILESLLSQMPYHNECFCG